MTIGTGSFSPWGRFTFPRSYIAGVINCSAGFTLHQTANRFTLNFAPVFPSIYTWEFNLKFWVWSSNVWTLDHIITECYYQNPPDPTKIPLDFSLDWIRTGAHDAPYLRLAPNHNTANPVIGSFPSFPPSYWTRPT